MDLKKEIIKIVFYSIEGNSYPLAYNESYINKEIENIFLQYNSMEILELGRKYNFPVSAVRAKEEIISGLNSEHAPGHGENTDKILKNNDYKNDEIDNLKNKKIVK